MAKANLFQTKLSIVLAVALVTCGCEAAQQKVYKPAELNQPAGERYILTPKASPKPQINGASVFGARPGRPFLFMIPATGDRPMTFAAEGLP
jgi:alpha-galactosidase